VSFVRFALKRRRKKAACLLECFDQLAILVVRLRGFPHSQQENSCDTALIQGWSNFSAAEGHTDYCGQVHGPHVEA
jgi:hypothetical protein